MEYAKELIERSLNNANEVCGFILSGIVYECDNRSDDPENTFQLPKWKVSRLCVSAGDGELIFWHSHPKSRPVPSKGDIDFMERTKRPHVIVGLKPFPIVVLYGWEGKRIVQMEKICYDRFGVQGNSEDLGTTLSPLHGLQG